MLESCRRSDRDALLLPNQKGDAGPICRIHNAPRSPNYRYAYSVVRRWTLDGVKFTLEDIGDALLKNSTYLLVSYLSLLDLFFTAISGKNFNKSFSEKLQKTNLYSC